MQNTLYPFFGFPHNPVDKFCYIALSFFLFFLLFFLVVIAVILFETQSIQKSIHYDLILLNYSKMHAYTYIYT